MIPRIPKIGRNVCSDWRPIRSSKLLPGKLLARTSGSGYSYDVIPGSRLRSCHIVGCGSRAWSPGRVVLRWHTFRVALELVMMFRKVDAVRQAPVSWAQVDSGVDRTSLAPRPGVAFPWIEFCAVMFIVVGVAIRLAAFFADRALWTDEIAVALNLRFRSYLGLLRPLDFDQTMPVPLLCAAKAAADWFGPRELAFRAVFLVSGCLLLVALWRCMRRFAGSSIACIATGIAAVSPPLIWYSCTLKQYGSDALITVLVLGISLRLLVEKDDRAWPALICWGMAAIVLSQPAPFVVGATALAALLDGRFRSSLRWRAFWYSAAALWLGEFAIVSAVSYRQVMTNTYMQSYWAGSFLDLSTPNWLHRLAHALGVVAGHSWLRGIPAAVLAAMCLVGFRSIYLRFRGAGLCLASVPFAFMFLASAFRLYPIADRLALFTCPLLLWIYASAITYLAGLTRGRWREICAGTLTLAMMGAAVAALADFVRKPPLTIFLEDGRDVVSQMNTIDRSSPVLVVSVDYWKWAYYGGDWNDPATLKRRIDTNLAIVSHGAHRGTLLQFSPGANGRRELVDGMCLGNRDDDAARAEREADTIMAAHFPFLWLFTPTDTLEFRGSRQFGLLRGALLRRGARLVSTCQQGKSLAVRYRLP